MTAIAAPRIMSDSEAAAYIAQRAPNLGLDAAAVLSVANGEGLYQGHRVGDTDKGGFGSYGPFQLNGSGGALPASIKAQGAAYAQAWAWSSDGIDYALQQIQSVGSGLQGAPAIAAIITNFERPADIPASITNAIARLGKWAQAIAQGMPLPGVTTPSTGVVPPGQTTTDTPITTQATTQVGTLVGGLQTFVAGLFGPGLNALHIKADMSGLILLLASIFAILIGAIIWNGEGVKSGAKQAPATAAKWVMMA